MRHAAPTTDFGEDPWVLRVHGVDAERAGQQETVFSLSNGQVGVRGSWEQGSPLHEPGTLVNGFHEVWPIEYPEAGYGFATTGQTIVYVPDATSLRVLVDDELLDLSRAEVVRTLDMRRGVLEVSARWPNISVTWQRLVSLEEGALLAARVEVTVDRPAKVEIDSVWRNRQDSDYLASSDAEFDPRRAPSFPHPVLIEKDFERSPDGLSFEVSYRTVTSGMELSCLCHHRPDPRLVAAIEGKQTRFTAHLDSGESVRVDKFSRYALGPHDASHENDFDAIVAAQMSHLDRFWARNQVVVDNGPALQQALNWLVFQLHQASAQTSGTGIPAKGLTGQAYEGHCFWDMDMFMLPFVVHTDPAAAARLIRFRHNMLPQARRRARQLALKGASFPWRTINGEEGSAYFEAGTAQYHVNAAVIHGLGTYVEATGDRDLLWECGVEMAIETARMWTDLGFYDATGSFHLHMVTGPDEYSALVDDNAYTNLMAQASLRQTVTWVEEMRRDAPEMFHHLVTLVQLEEEEIERWSAAAQAMHIPHDPVRGLTPQDARFLHRQPWDWTTPAESYPLLLHFHPLVIYRHQVLKQADVVMAVFTLPEAFAPELAAANFHYYDPITTGDSSLSPPVQAAVAAMIGDNDRAVTYLYQSALVDLADLADNTADGVHLAAAGGTWTALLRGFLGVRISSGQLTVWPRIPPQWRRLSMAIQVGNSHLRISATPTDVALVVEDGPPMRIEVWGQPVDVTGQHVVVQAPESAKH